MLKTIPVFVEETSLDRQCNCHWNAIPVKINDRFTVYPADGTEILFRDNENILRRGTYKNHKIKYGRKTIKWSDIIYWISVVALKNELDKIL